MGKKSLGMQVLEGAVDVGNAVGRPVIALTTQPVFWIGLVVVIAVIFIAFIVIPGARALIIGIFNWIRPK